VAQVDLKSVRQGAPQQIAFKHADTVIQLFTKAPVKGQVKTRLEPALGQDEIVVLYRNLIETRVKGLMDAGFCQLNLWAASNPGHEFFTALQSQYPIEVYNQEGADLGGRMDHCVQSGLKTHRKVIVLGGDCVSVDLDYLAQAIQALDESPVVLGPAEDGGYVLVGTCVDKPEIFADVDWGTEQVLAQTVANLKQQQLAYRLLDTRWDLDRPEDLERLKQSSIMAPA